MKIVFFGTPSFVIPVLKVLKENFDVVAVVTAPDQKSGRKQVISPSPVAKFCNDNYPSIQILKDEKLNTTVVQKLASLEADLFVVAAYGKLIPQDILNIPKHGSLNIHPSLLPKYRGPSPIQTTIVNCDKETGITIIQLDSQLDHGPILKQEVMKLSGNETFETLANSMFEKSAELIKSVIPEYVNDTIKPIPQNHDKATYTKHISKQDGYIDIQNPPSSENLDRMIRAYYPWPGVWTKLGELRIKLLPENKLQVEGKKPVSLKDFLNGHRELEQKILPLFG